MNYTILLSNEIQPFPPNAPPFSSNKIILDMKINGNIQYIQIHS